jgi:hypothetical protein
VEEQKMSLVYMFVILVTVLGITLLFATRIRRSVPKHVLQTNNEAAIVYVTIIGVIYGVFLAFVILALWERRSKAEDHVESESAQLYVLFRLAREFPAPLGAQLVQEILAYNKGIVESEWPLMVNLDLGQLEQRSSELDKIWEKSVSFRPASVAEQILYKQALEACEKIYVARRMRLVDAEDGLGYFMWAMIIIGGFTVIVPTLFLHVEHFGYLIVAKTCMVVLLMLTAYTIYDLQRPFRGSWPVEPAPYKFIQERMERVVGGQGRLNSH